MKPWKKAEKEVATKLGGVRRVRVSRGESVGDILHPEYSIEVKYGKQVPKYCCVKYPTIIKTNLYRYFLLPSSYEINVVPSEVLVMWSEKIKDVGSLTFIDDAHDQAVQYDPEKKPLVAVKKKNMKGFVLIERR